MFHPPSSAAIQYHGCSVVLQHPLRNKLQDTECYIHWIGIAVGIYSVVRVVKQWGNHDDIAHYYASCLFFSYVGLLIYLHVYIMAYLLIYTYTLWPNSSFIMFILFIHLVGYHYCQ